MTARNRTFTYCLVGILLKFPSKRQSRFLLLHREHGLGAFLRASQAILACRQGVQDFAFPTISPRFLSNGSITLVLETKYSVGEFETHKFLQLPPVLTANLGLCSRLLTSVSHFNGLAVSLGNSNNPKKCPSTL